MANGLADNCQAYRKDGTGKIVGVQLGIGIVSGARYEVYSVRLRDEYEAQGQTVARCKVVDRNGIDTGIAVRMAWPGQGPTFQASALPGNPSNEHPVVNKFWPPSQGPLAFFVGDHNKPQSDIVYGIGLPEGHHVSYDVIFRYRGAIVQPPVDPEVPTVPDSDLAKQVARNTADIAELKALMKQWIGD